MSGVAAAPHQPGRCSPAGVEVSVVVHPGQQQQQQALHGTPKRRRLVPNIALLHRSMPGAGAPRVGDTAPGHPACPAASSTPALSSSAGSSSLVSGGSLRRHRCLDYIDPSYTAMSGLCAASEVGTPRGGSIRIQHLTAAAAAAAAASATSGGGSGPASLGMAPGGGIMEGEAPLRFPRLDECAHFHYDHVELGPIQVGLYEDELKAPPGSSAPHDLEGDEAPLCLQVNSAGRSWLLRRSPRDFRTLDSQLHRCVWDRKFSGLPDLASPSALQPVLQESPENCARRVLGAYLSRFSGLAGSLINCGPVLSWLELDNRGRRLIVTEDSAINTPAVAAAYAVRRYASQAADEISFEVGDMISVIDMPPPQESIWWRGKRGFEVGFFPCDTVAVIGDKVPKNLHLTPAIPSAPPSTAQNTPHPHPHPLAAMLSASAAENGGLQPSKPVLRKHGKLIAFFRSFILNRPSRRRLKHMGILKERVFGCDLGEHLLNSGHEIPMVLKCCAEFIEASGIVDGIYRLSGVTSNIQKLRNAFDEDRIPALYEDEAILQDIHSVASLLKMYFRELPNPLCTYQLYPSFVAAVQAKEADRLVKMREAVQKLPPPHYRTLEYLIRHLARVASRGHETGMTPRNVAIVWAPNLLRCKELEVGGLGALQGVGVQAVVTEFLVCCCELIFCDSLPPEADMPAISEQAVSTLKRGVRPKSLAISTPTKLLSLEEARSRAHGGHVAPGAPSTSQQDYIDVGGGSSQPPSQYHTVLELPSRKRGSSLKAKRSPLGWRSLFGGAAKARQSISKPRKVSSPAQMSSSVQSEVLAPRRPLRPVKSAESLSSSSGGSQRNSAALDRSDMASPVGEPSDGTGGGGGGGTMLCTSFLPTSAPISTPAKPSHNRSVSHDSYFDLLGSQRDDDEGDGEGSLDLSEIQLNFELEESEMRIFSEDETLMSCASPATLSHHSAFGVSGLRPKPSPKAVPRARFEELSMSSADPSPKKGKKSGCSSGAGSPSCRKRSRTITPRSVKVENEDELRFIDSQSPEPQPLVVTAAEVHHVSETAMARSSGSSGLTTPGSPPRYAPLLSEQPSPLDTQSGLEDLYENIAASCGEEWPSGLVYQNVLPVTPPERQSQQEENLYEDVTPPAHPPSAPNQPNDPEEVYQQVKAFRRSVAELNDLIAASEASPMPIVSAQVAAAQDLSEMTRKSWSPAPTPSPAPQSEDLRRRFDCEIGRDIVRERRMRNELERVRASPSPSPVTATSPPSSLATSPVTTAAGPLLPSTDGSLTSLSSASFGPLSPAPSTPAPEKVTCNLIDLREVHSPKYRLSDANMSPQPDSESSDRVAFDVIERITCTLVDLSPQKARFHVVDEKEGSSGSSEEVNISPRTQDSEVTLLSPGSPELGISKRLSPIPSSEDASVSPEIGRVAPSSPQAALAAWRSVSPSSRGDPGSASASASTGSSPISPSPSPPQLGSPSPTSAPIPDSEGSPLEWTQPKVPTPEPSSSHNGQREVEVEREDEVELRCKEPPSDGDSTSTRIQSAPSGSRQPGTLQLHLTLTSRRSSEPSKSLSLADSRRLSNRKASVRELLTQFESSTSPGSAPGPLSPTSPQKPLPPCLRAKAAKSQLSGAMSASLDEDSFNRHARDLVRVRTAPDVRAELPPEPSSPVQEVQQPLLPSTSSSDDAASHSKVELARTLLSDVNLDDPERRERIEKYKEERRNFLREKYRSESFRGDREDDIVARLKHRTKGGVSPQDEAARSMAHH